MRKFLLIVLASLVFAGIGRVSAQQTEFATHSASHRVTWSFDPVNGVMKATPPAGYVVQGTLEPAAATTATATTYTGTIDVTLTIKLVSAVPQGALLRCSGNVGIEYRIEEPLGTLSTLTTGDILESTESVGASVSGSTATCKFSIPYSWTIPASTSKTTVTIQGIVGSVGVSEYVLDTVTGTKVLRVVRSTSQGLTGPATIPQDGTTTQLTASTVL
jgi:hypothetical protein